MKRHERLSALLRLVTEHQSMHIEEIIKELGVSAATARRDLDHLAQQQLLTRTHGGARTSPNSSDLPLRYKSGRQAPHKQRIANVAAALVATGEVVGLNGGTTTTEVAREIVLRTDLHDQEAQVVVVTNAVNIANELAVRPHVRVVLTGGVVRGMSYELTGPLATRILDDIAVDTLFLGVNAINTAGPYTHHDGEAAINAALVAHAGRVIVVADHTKLGASAFAKICDLDAINALITDSDADEASVAELRAAGLEVITA